jgi:dihydropteroate synthase
LIPTGDTVLPCCEDMVTPMEFQLKGQRLGLERPLLMGIVNVTPDSFFDGGQFCDPQRAVAHALRLVEEGADLLDIGAESTRPGALPVDEQEERRRLVPVVAAVAKAVSVPISVDTSKAEVARAAIDAGAIMVNDVTALRGDSAMVGVVAQAGVALVLMHMQGTPDIMQHAPRYDDVVGEVAQFLAERVRYAIDHGVARDRIVVDPGIGFGKTLGESPCVRGIGVSSAGWSIEKRIHRTADGSICGGVWVGDRRRRRPGGRAGRDHSSCARCRADERRRQGCGRDCAANIRWSARTTCVSSSVPTAFGAQRISNR